MQLRVLTPAFWWLFKSFTAKPGRAFDRRTQAGGPGKARAGEQLQQPLERPAPSHLPKHKRHCWHQLHHMADAAGLLLQVGVPLLDDTEDGSNGSGLMHHEFVVVDDRSMITGNANFTSSGLHGDAGKPRTRGDVNHVLRIDSPALAAVFRQEFERMWGDRPGGPKDSPCGLGKGGQPDAERAQVGDVEIEVPFPPHPKRNPSHGLNWLAALLTSAKQKIDMALFVFSFLGSTAGGCAGGARQRRSEDLAGG